MRVSIFLVSLITFSHSVYIKPSLKSDGSAFRTGAWSIEEEEAVTTLYNIQISTSNNSRIQWTKMSRVLGRSPDNIRMHFNSKYPGLLPSVKKVGKERIRVHHGWSEEDNSILIEAVRNSAKLDTNTDWDALALKLNRSRTAVHTRYKEDFIGVRRKKARNDEGKRTESSLWVQQNKGLGDIALYRSWTDQEDAALMDMVDEAMNTNKKPTFSRMARTLERSRFSVYGRYKRNRRVRGLSDVSAESSVSDNVSDVLTGRAYDDEDWLSDDLDFSFDDESQDELGSERTSVNRSPEAFPAVVSSDEMDALVDMGERDNQYGVIDLEDYGLKMPFEEKNDIAEDVDADYDLEYII